ncbi:MAG: hypothetical protein QXJ27_05540, partial [Thermoplasmata archaeon]
LESQLVTMDILKALCKEGKIVVSVFHDINLAKFATHVLFLGKRPLFGKAEILTARNISRYLNVDEEIVRQYCKISI